jgi:hypothetical protein
MAIITISRGSYGRGKEVAEMVAERRAPLAEQLRSLFKRVGREFWPLRTNLHLPDDVKLKVVSRLKTEFTNFLGRRVAHLDRTGLGEGAAALGAAGVLGGEVEAGEVVVATTAVRSRSAPPPAPAGAHRHDSQQQHNDKQAGRDQS